MKLVQAVLRFATVPTIALVVIAASAADNVAAERSSPAKQYKSLAARLERLIAHELAEKRIPAISIALVDANHEGDPLVWSAGFGVARPVEKTPATSGTVYRAGSISKLFTAIAVMQLVEQGKLDLDAPVTNYLPEFQPQNRFGKPITLRHLMSHRAGLVRESPVGSYFDDGGPTLTATVASLNQTALVAEPGTQTKYSNAGVAVVGEILARTQQADFARHVASHVIQPLQLDRTGFELTPAIQQHLAEGQMWTYDGRTFPAPVFPLGTAPAGNLFSSVDDLARFAVCLLREGMTDDRQLLKPATLQAMWTPQFAGEKETTGFGLGFHCSQWEGRRRVGHGGAIYGYATQLSILPDEKLGVVVAASQDIANGVVSRIADEALRGLLTARTGQAADQKPADLKLTGPLPAELATRLAGRYQADGAQLDVHAHNGRAYLRLGSFRRELKALADAFIVDDSFGTGPEVRVRSADVLEIDGKAYTRVDDTRPEPIPERWEGLIGEYGWDHNTLYILEDRGQLWALIEWFFYYPLREINQDEYAFPNDGLYPFERIVFSRGSDGTAKSVVAAGVDFPRRPVGTPEGLAFRIDPLHPVAELRQAALAAQPPVEKGEFRPADLVEPSRLDQTILLDVRYATRNNFLGEVLYDEPRAFLQRPAAEAVLRVQQKLQPLGYGLLIHDAYRPWYVTKIFYDATPAAMKHFVANPAQGSRHNRGAAVDLTLYDLATGKALPMPSGYDEFSPRASPEYPGETSRARWQRDLLRTLMESEGFTVYDVEWWHFDYRDWRKYPIGTARFSELKGGKEE